MQPRGGRTPGTWAKGRFYSRAMMRCKADPSLRRTVVGNFQFPLGVYPVEDMVPKAGFASHFEQADGGGDGDAWEEWPDRYAYDIVASAERLPALCRALFSLFDGRVYPILDVLGQDAYREIDPFIAYELVGLDRFLDGVRLFKDYLYEDGMCGFGLMAEEPFLYVFVDEHKIITVRAEPSMKERVERVLGAFELEQTEHAAGADASAHEHRGVIVAPDNRPELMTSDEALEFLKRHWRLVLNIDPDSNVDDAGKELGVTHWRAMVRCDLTEETVRYAEVVFDAANLRQAEEVAFSACEDLSAELEGNWEDATLVVIDRLTPEGLAQVLANAPATPEAKEEGAKRTGTARSSKGKSGKAGKAKDRAGMTDQTPSAGHVYFARWVGEDR